MINRGRFAELLQGPDEMVLAEFPRLLPDLDESELLDLLELLEDHKTFQKRLPLRLQLYAIMVESAPDEASKLIALIRLLRRLGSRKDLPNLGDIPEQLPDFAEYMGFRAVEILGNTPLAMAMGELAWATRAFRAGDLNEMKSATDRGVVALSNVESWVKPPDQVKLIDLAIAETGHELLHIAVNAAHRSGDLERGRELAESWSDAIEAWENVLGPLPRQRYQYFRIVGHIDHEVGLLDASLEAYNRALEHAPTAYTRAFLWLSTAQVERELGRKDDSWDHATAAIKAWQESPYPQAARSWIEWLALDADSPEKFQEIEILRKRQIEAGGVETNRVVQAMTDLYRVLGSLRGGSDPGELAPLLDKLIRELEEAGSWPNLITILGTRAVVAGRLNDREGMDGAIERARKVMAEKFAPEARPPSEFFLESAHALALRDVGEYRGAFNALFERALEARMKYPGGMGPDEQTAFEALYYLGALAGHDPDTIEKRVRATLAG